jgi:hypothetical protein
MAGGNTIFQSIGWMGSVFVSVLPGEQYQPGKAFSQQKDET